MSLPTSQTQTLGQALQKAIGEDFLFGNTEFIDHLVIAFLARGHVLIEGPPGTGKTMSAKIMAELLAKSFKRIQFTTDMLPADIIGAPIYSPATHEFQFIPGPIFADFILADEINRTPPRTQSALLESMEERQVTVEGKSYPLSEDFFVLATQNPRDFEGTFPLPEAQLDRFIFKLTMKPAEGEAEVQILRNILTGKLPPPFGQLKGLNFNRKEMDQEISKIKIDDSILRYVTHILDRLRKHPMLNWGSSARGGIALVKAAQIKASLEGREMVIPDDIKRLALVSLRHRIRLSPDAMVSNVTEDHVISEILQKVEFPI